MHVDDLERRPVHLRVLLGRADQRRDPGGGVLDLVHQHLGLDRVRQPAHRAVESPSPGTSPATWSSQSTSSPAGDEHRREVPAVADAVVVQPVAELVLGVAGLHRAELGRLGDPLDRLLLQLDQRRAASPGRSRRRPACASLCRIPATRSRSAAVARTAAAAGLFSSWVSPADSEPRASSRSRSLTSRWLFCMPRKMPVEQVHRHREPLAHHRRPTRPPAAGRIRMSVTASTVAPYVCWARSVLR